MPDLSEGTKYDDGKIPMDLLSPYFLLGISEVLQFGAEKYEPYNWAKGIKYSRVFSAMQRHLWAFWAGEDLDAETGKPHLWHAGCCLMFLTHYEFNYDQYKEFDDSPQYQEITGGRDTKEELSGPRRLSGEDTESTVAPESMDANRVQSKDKNWKNTGYVDERRGY